MITVEIKSEKNVDLSNAQVEIYCDSDGLALLLKQISYLQSGSSHVHLMTPAWAGSELDEKKNGKETELINHLKIIMLPKK